MSWGEAEDKEGESLCRPFCVRGVLGGAENCGGVVLFFPHHSDEKI